MKKGNAHRLPPIASTVKEVLSDGSAAYDVGLTLPAGRVVIFGCTSKWRANRLARALNAVDSMTTGKRQNR